jgi:hypothetical protein
VKSQQALAALSGAALLLAAASLTACSGDDTGEKLDTWAKGVCDQIAVQTTKINDANAALTKVDSGGDPKALQQADSAAYGQNAESFKAIAGILDAAGPAPGGGGEEYQQKAVSSFTGLSTQYAALQKKVDALDTGDRDSFAQGLQGASTLLQKAVTQGDQARSALRQGSQGKAVAKQPGCQGLSQPTSASGPASPPAPPSSAATASGS